MDMTTCIKRPTLQGINISYLGKRKIIFKSAFLWDMLVPRRVFFPPVSPSLGPVFVRRRRRRASQQCCPWMPRKKMPRMASTTGTRVPVRSLQAGGKKPRRWESAQRINLNIYGYINSKKTMGFFGIKKLDQKEDEI